jgi:hypothetical protein
METPKRAEYARSAQMAAVLRAGFLYSEKRARDCVFTALEMTLPNSSEPTLATLTRSTLQAARLEAARIRYELLNSEIVTRAVFNAMIRAGVLLGPGGHPIALGIGSYAARVAALRPSFRDETECFLLEYLIQTLGDVGTRDHLALAHVLFRQFDIAIPMADLEDRVVTLLDSMSDRIELHGGRTYAIRKERVCVETVGST